MSLGDRVLIIDESPVVRAALRLALENAGYWVHEAKDESASRELLGRSGYDLVLLGLSPRTGFGPIATARSAGASVVVLVASLTADLHARAIERGADLCLLKQPDSGAEVVRAARRLLRAPVAAWNGRWRACPSAAA